MQELERVEQLGDHTLIEELAHSAQHDRLHTVRLLAELGEVHARGLFRELGFSTMFDYATRKLGMSEAEAALRLRAAKLGRMFPSPSRCSAAASSISRRFRSSLQCSLPTPSDCCTTHASSPSSRCWS